MFLLFNMPFAVEEAAFRSLRVTSLFSKILLFFIPIKSLFAIVLISPFLSALQSTANAMPVLCLSFQYAASIFSMSNIFHSPEGASILYALAGFVYTGLLLPKNMQEGRKSNKMQKRRGSDFLSITFINQA